MIGKRIWNELDETVFYNYYLAEFIHNRKRKSSRIEVFSYIFSIAAIFGWFKFPDHNYLWSITLVSLQLINLFRSKFVISKEQLAYLELVNKYYNRQRIEIEKLWQNFYAENISEDLAKIRFNEIQDAEVEMINLYNHEKVENIKKLNFIASNKKVNYLKRFYA